MRAGLSFTGGEAGGTSKGSIPAGTCPGKDVTCHKGWGWLQLGWKTSESSRRERNRPRDTHERLSRKTSPVFCSPSSAWSLHTAAKPRTCCGQRSSLCSGERPGGPACPGGTARRGNKALRSQKATFTRGRTLGPCPTEPGGARPSGAGNGEREGGDGAGREGKGREGRREAGRRPALAAAIGGGSR